MRDRAARIRTSLLLGLVACTCMGATASTFISSPAVDHTAGRVVAVTPPASVRAALRDVHPTTSLQQAGANPFSTSLPLTTHRRLAAPPAWQRLTLLDEIGQLAYAVSAPQVGAWRDKLHSQRLSGSEAALLHLRLGEYELASNQQPEVATWHFEQVQKLVHQFDLVSGLARYDTAIAHYTEGAFRLSTEEFYSLLSSSRSSNSGSGYSRGTCALWYRHSLACYQEHAAHGRIGIPEPERLDPNCGIAALAASLRRLGLPCDRSTLLSACRVTGVGSSMNDLVEGGRKLGAQVRVVGANDTGLMAMPKPCIAFVERDHFVAVVDANRKGVAYLCSDCGPWPGGRVDLTWDQWHALNPGTYGVVSRKGSNRERRFVSQLNGRTPWMEPVRLASRLPLIGLGVRQLAPVVAILRGQMIMSCGHKAPTQHCPAFISCPMDQCSNPSGPAGASAGDPVNLATMEEEYQPDDDLNVYNPHGPSISWGRVYNSLRTPDTTYASDDFGIGWSQSYNYELYDPSVTLPTQIVQGSSASFNSSANDLPAAGLAWDIVLNGSTVATSTAPNGWSVTIGTSQFTVGVPASAASAPNYEIRSATKVYYGNSAFFGALPPATDPQGVASPAMNVTGTDAPANGASWDITLNGAVIASSAQANGWSLTMPTSTSLAVTSPLLAAVGSNYEARYQYYTASSAFFSVSQNRFMPSSGANNTKYFIEPNGARISFTAPTVPSAAQPAVQCTVQAGAPLLVEWDYDSGCLTGHYKITAADRSKWVTTPPSKLISGGALCYSLGQLVDCNGNAVNCYYTSTATAAGFPVLAAMTDASNGSTLLSIQHATDGTGNVLSVSDAYGRSIYYHEGNYGGDQEVDTVSQVVTTGTANPPFRYQYGYQTFYLHTITVPSPTGAGSSTATINYSISTNAVSSLVDGNGNTRSYAAGGMGGGMKVTVTNPQSVVAYSYTATNDSNMSETSTSDGNNGTTQSWTYSDPSDPYQPSSVLDAEAIYTVAPGSSKTFNATGSDAPATGTWDIVTGGTTLASSVTPNGWSVSCMYGQFNLSAPTNAAIGSRYEVRDNYTTGQNASVFFDVATNKGPARFTWDPYGNLTSMTNPRGTMTTYGRSYANFALGELMQVQVGSKSPITHTYYEPSGLTHTETSPLPGTVGSNQTVTTSYTYDGLGNVLTVSTPGNNSTNTITTTYNYTSDGGYNQPAAIDQPLTITDNLGHVTHFRYDQRGNRTAEIDALGNETDQSYNLADDSVITTYPATGQTGTGHASSVESYLYPDGPLAIESEFDESGQQVRQVTTSYGLEGETLSVSGSTEPVSYTYDALYRKKTLSDGKGNPTTYSYNTAGYLSGITYPGGDTLQYTQFDANGNVLKRIDGNNVETDYLYNDPQSLATDIQYPASPAINVHFAYDGYGRRATMTDGAGARSYTYDDLDKIQNVQVSYTGLPSQTVGYSYYANGSQYQENTPAGTFVTAYDAVGRATSLTNPFSEQSSWTYLNNDLVATQTLGNGVMTSFIYNARRLPLRLQSNTAANTLLTNFGGNAGMVYDALGNRTSVPVNIPGAAIATGTTGYTYNSQYELTQEQSTRNAGYTNTFGYDAAFNPTSFKGATSTFNSNNQNSAFSFDRKGNPVTYKGSALSFSAENQLTAYANTSTAGYDGNGLRAWKQTGAGRTYFIYDARGPVCELNGSGNVVAVNTFGPTGLLSRHTAAGTVFYTFDPQGNVAQRLDANGSALSTSLFDAFGQRLSSDGGEPWGYNAQEGYYTDPETGLQLANYRYYDPSQARFLNRDPSGYDGGINLYGYCGNNPVTESDPTGLMPRAEPGCREATVINAAIKKACQATRHCAASCGVGWQLPDCLRKECKRHFFIYCGGPSCPGNCGYTDGSDGSIHICSIAGDWSHCGRNGIPQNTSSADLIARTILHELMHPCGIWDFWPGHGHDPGAYSNPAEYYARCLLHIPGSMHGYLSGGHGPND